MEAESVTNWERRLKELFDEIDDELEDRYGPLFSIHPSRPRRGATSNKEHDGLFNVGASFSAGFGSQLGRGYVIDFDVVTLETVPSTIKEQIEHDVYLLVEERIPRYFPSSTLRVGRDQSVIKIHGDIFRFKSGGE